jgi:GNAT superfamily N-acetyltransferase
MTAIRDAGVQDAAAIARVHVETWRSAYAGIVPAQHLAGMSIERRAVKWDEMLRSPRPGWFAVVAQTSAGEIIGFASSGPERSGDPLHQGEIGALYILRQHQRQGIGRRLVAAAAAKLRAQGMPSMLIWVLADNASRGFYEALGGRYLRERTIQIGGADLPELAYGWDDMRMLIRCVAPEGS